MGTEVRAATTAELKPGDMKMVQLGEEQVLLANVKGRFYAVSDICTHAECALSGGTLEGEEVECPCHGSRFNVTTGEVTQAPAEDPLKTFKVRIVGKDVVVSLER